MFGVTVLIVTGESEARLADAAVTRRALSIGVAHTTGMGELSFASTLVRGLAEKLENLGYQCVVRDTGPLPAAELGRAVQRQLNGQGVTIVHVLSHGHLTEDGGTVYVLGSDGAPDETTDIGAWLAGVQNVGDRPLTLFLLDLCHGGHQARLPWYTRAAVTRGWVIAACEPDQAAFDGRFTKAVINVLTRLAAGGLDVDPALPHVPLPLVAREIGLEVNRLTGGGYAQQVTATRVDISDDLPDLPFFRNPRYDDTSLRPVLRRELDRALVPFLDDLDEGLDARHFLDRAGGTRVAAGQSVGCFTGRRAQLRELTDWFNGYGGGALQVVTGSAGVGKSALLGLLVCAAHPRLREPTRPLWEKVERVPYPVTIGLAAVHARRRTVVQVRASIARQLYLEDLGNLADLPEQPVIVVDALDEAEDGPALAADLVSLAAIVRPDGRPAARLLVGTRRDESYGALMEAAEVTDLDEVDWQILRVDLENYVTELLRGVPEYADRAAVRGGFAGKLAAVLAGPEDRPGGEFLVAGLYTRHFITAHAADPLTDPVHAEREGAEAPRSVPQVLELDLRLRRDQPWLSPVLECLAHARGQGMPETVLSRVCLAFCPPGVAPEPEDVRSALDLGSFYLRRVTDPADGTVLYRLFHEGLAEHLRDKRGTAGHDDGPAWVSPPSSDTLDSDILDRLLEPIGPPGERDWALAEPYVVRHALEHAQAAQREYELLDDTGFLLQVPSMMLEPSFDSHGLADALQATADEPITVRQGVLALAALRKGRVIRLPPGLPPTWTPLWVKSVGNVHPGAQNELAAGHTCRTKAAVVAKAKGRPVAVTGGSDGAVRVWDLASGTPIGDPLSGHTDWVWAVAVTELDGRPVAVTGGGDMTVRVWDLVSGAPIGDPLTGHTGGVWAMAVNGRPVIPSSDGGLSWAGDLAGGEQASRSTAVIMIVDWVLIAGPSGSVELVELVSGAQAAVAFPAEADPLTAHPVQVGGRDLIALRLRNGEIGLWDSSSGSLIDLSADLIAPPSAVTRRPIAVRAGRLAELAASAGSIRLVYPRTGESLTPDLHAHEGQVTAVAVCQVSGRSLGFTGGTDGWVRVWDLDRWQARDAIYLGDPVTALTATPSGYLILVTEREVIAFRQPNDDFEGGLP